MDIPNITIERYGVDMEFKVKTAPDKSVQLPDYLTVEVTLLNPDGSESEVRAGVSRVKFIDRSRIKYEAYLLANNLARGLYTEFHVGARPYYYLG